MDHGSQGSHDDNEMQPYFPLMQQWTEPMNVDQQQDISWNYGGAASDW